MNKTVNGGGEEAKEETDVYIKIIVFIHYGRREMDDEGRKENGGNRDATEGH